MSEGFLGRWSRRKIDSREGRTVEPEPAESELASPPRQLPPSQENPLPSLAEGRGEDVTPAEPKPESPPPTLEDVKGLTSDSDFTRFLSPQVAPEVKNAALKKLFSDPRFNVMDRMDVYIDDYTKPDPIPEGMMRKLATVHLLRSFEPEQQDKTGETRDVADANGIQSVAQSDEVPPAEPEPSVHADPDLRLQQDDAAEGPEPGRDTR